MRIGAYAGVGVGDQLATYLAAVHDLSQMLDIDLMDDARTRGHNFEIVEGALPPTQELVAFPVALVFNLDVLGQRLGRSESLGYHGMIYHHLGW